MVCRPQRLLLVAACIVVTFGSAQSFAQTTQHSDAQRAFNDRGVQHMFDGEYGEAAAAFRSSLELGESNVTLLNYGRALFKMERCHEARDAFVAVPSAPAVEAPSAEEVATVLDEFTEEWADVCTGRLTIECPDEPAELRVGDSEYFVCHTDPIPVVPGEHTIFVRGWDEPLTVRVGDEPRMLSLQRSLPMPDTDEIDLEERPAPSEAEATRYAGRGSGTRRAVGVAFAGTGLAALATSAALEVAWVGPRRDAYRDASTSGEQRTTLDRWESARAANRLVLFTGLGATVVGATLWATPGPRRAGLAVKVGAGPSISAKVRW